MSDRFKRQRSCGGRTVVYVSEIPLKPHPQRLFAHISDPLGRLYECAGVMSPINPAYIDAQYEVAFCLTFDAFRCYDTIRNQ